MDLYDCVWFILINALCFIVGRNWGKVASLEKKMAADLAAIKDKIDALAGKAQK